LGRVEEDFLRWYSPKIRVAETVGVPHDDEEANYMLSGGTDSWAFVAEYQRLWGDGMGIEQAMQRLGLALTATQGRGAGRTDREAPSKAR
jgi:hypothetical protein